MARLRTVNEAFSTLLERIAPLPSELAAREAHLDSMRGALRGEFGGFGRLEVFGSHSRGTAIRTSSDVDYLAVLAKTDITWGDSVVSSTRTLDRVKSALQNRFTSTNVRVRGCAVIVEFSDGAVDVVPGVYDGPALLSGHPVFSIPDGSGGWRQSSPAAHKKYLTDAHATSGSHLFYAARLLKQWRSSRVTPIPLLGFHMELLLASESTCTPGKRYAQCVRDCLKVIRDRNGRGLIDPVGISGTINVADTEARRAEVVKAAGAALDHADKALFAESRGDDDEAFRQWDIVFNGSFPGRWT